MLFESAPEGFQPCEREEMYNRQDCYVAVNGIHEEPDLLSGTVASTSLQDLLNNHMIRFESREGMDLFCFAKLAFPHHQVRLERIYVLLGPGWIQFLCEEAEPVKDLFASLVEERSVWTPGKLICRLFESQSGQDIKHLEYLEGRIAGLEDSVMTGKNRKDYVQQMIRLRKYLMKLRRIYEQMFDLLEDLSANENGLLDDLSLKYVKIYAGKIDRLYDHVGHLQEYVTEIREAYQAQVDIGLNQIMKFFTVITSIFLPLTLIAGWYGMNLKMPEYGWEWGYPAVVIVSLLVVAAEILYFKKNKWF